MLDKAIAQTYDDIFFTNFPREFGLKREIVYSQKDMLKKINYLNGKMNLYTNIFYYPLWKDTNYGIKPVYQEPVINAVYFDIDTEERSYKDMLNLHNWCMGKDVKHFVLLSGRGYHVYIFVNPDFTNKHEAILSFANFLENKLDGDYDDTAKGNLAKISRIPNTYNIKRGNFCIPLTKDQIENGNFEEHRKLAQKQQFINPMIGKNRLDISHFSEVKVFSKYKLRLDDGDIVETSPSLEAAISVGTIGIYSLPPCIYNMLLNPELNYEGRHYVMKYFAGLGYTLNQIKEIFRNFLSHEKYHHALETHMREGMSIEFKRKLSCDALKMKSFCPQCPRKSPYEFLLDDFNLSNK